MTIPLVILPGDQQDITGYDHEPSAGIDLRFPENVAGTGIDRLHHTCASLQGERANNSSILNEMCVAILTELLALVRTRRDPVHIGGWRSNRRCRGVPYAVRHPFRKANDSPVLLSDEDQPVCFLHPTKAGERLGIQVEMRQILHKFKIEVADPKWHAAWHNAHAPQFVRLTPSIREGRQLGVTDPRHIASFAVDQAVDRKIFISNCGIPPWTNHCEQASIVRRHDPHRCMSSQFPRRTPGYRIQACGARLIVPEHTRICRT